MAEEGVAPSSAEQHVVGQVRTAPVVANESLDAVRCDVDVRNSSDLTIVEFAKVCEGHECIVCGVDLVRRLY